jgi:hypothetical protein
MKTNPKMEKAVDGKTANPGNVQSKLIAPARVPATRNSEPEIALRKVRITLELIEASHGRATAVAHSGLDQQDGTRLIRIGLCAPHVLVNRSLRRTDTFTVRFLIGLSLIEYIIFWWKTHDGQGVNGALRQAAGYAPDERAWGSAFASRLAISELLCPVDQLPIFGPAPKAGPHQLGEFKAVLKHPSDIPRWRVGTPGGEPVQRKAKAFQTLNAGKSEAAASLPPPTPAPRAPSFAETFLGCARETLDTATITALTELTKERLS